MIKTIIIDDEPKNIKLLTGIINEHCPGVEVVGSTDDLTEVAALVHDLRPNLLLLDIEFPAGNIFTVLENLSYRNYQVIFVTAHNTYASEAFKQNAVDYILKPVTKDALMKAIKRGEERIHNSGNSDISKLLEKIKSSISHPGKIPIPSSEGILFVNQEDIVRCEASGRYTFVYLTNGKKLTISRTLKEIEDLLDPWRFFRIHNSHIINLSMIKKYNRGKGGTAELTDGSVVEVSSSRKDDFLNILLKKPGE